MHAGFDGVEIHGANGYVPDQFLQDIFNKRTDAYGGPIKNRSSRCWAGGHQGGDFVWGADRVGVRIARSGSYGSMSDSEPATTFGSVSPTST